MEHQVHVGDIVDVTITGIQPYGAFALLPDGSSGLIHISEIKGDYYNFDDVTKSLRGERKGKIFKLGQKVRVVVTNASKENSTIDFNLAEDNKNGNTK